MAQIAVQAQDIEFPEPMQGLFEPARYKVLYGGRGGAKSWGVARALLLIGAQRPLRVLCARELQNSIAESVHKLLSSQIEKLGLQAFYRVMNTSIVGLAGTPAEGTEFLFEGIKHNVDRIKSMEGIDVCWVEEGDKVSKSSWDILIPTIRKAGSEIWVIFNPNLRKDDTYQRFVVNPPKRSTTYIRKVSWRDNPWFGDELRLEMEELREKDYDSYLHVWEGHCKTNLEGAVYAKELRAATAEGRICRVPYDATKPVYTFWDLGWADKTSIWFGQIVGFETRVIDYYENSQKPVEHYLKELQARPYSYGTLWLPHDAKAKQYGSGKSTEEIVRAKGWTVRIVPRLSLADGINAARTIFQNCAFDEAHCQDGLEHLRNYRYEIDPDTGGFSAKPVHDEASHGADGFRYMAIAMKEPKKRGHDKLTEKAKSKLRLHMPFQSSTWLGR